MNLQVIVAGRNIFRFRALLFSLAIGAASIFSLGWQTGPLHSARDSSIKSHFAAAQNAQRNMDYATAEREYQSVLAIEPDFAEVYMNLGLIYQLQNRSSDAIPEFRHALKLKPSLAGANFFLGVDYCRSGEGAKAIPHLKAALQAEPKRLDVWLWLATAQEISGQLHAEIITLHHALQLQPNDADSLYLLGSVYERLGKKEVAHLEKIAPGSARSEQLLAESYAASDEWPTAVIHFQNALAAAPGQTGLHAELGQVLLRAGKTNQAIREFDEELRQHPGNLIALTRRGEVRLIQGNVDAALKDWEQAISIDVQQAERILGLREVGFGDSALEQLPESTREQILKVGPLLQDHNSASAHLALAFLAEQKGDVANAAKEMEIAASAARQDRIASKCTEADVEHALQREEFFKVAPCAKNILTPQASGKLRIRVASALLQSGQPDAALATLDELAGSDSASAEADYWRARCYEKLATASYLQLYRADPNSYRLHQLVGDLEAAKGDDAKAIEEYQTAIALRPSSPNLHYSLGHLLWKDLKIPEARVELEAELSLNPSHAGALHDLGDTYLLEHQPNKALPYLERALATDSANPDLHRDLGSAYTELGDNRKAKAQFEIAVSADHDGSVHYKLARVYQALGEKDKATREFALSTKLNRESHEKLEKQTGRLGEVTRSADDSRDQK